MNIKISDTKEALGKEAANLGAELISRIIAEKGSANIIVATGASQFEMLATLITKDLDWSVVTGFHLDEYIGISIDHPASFRKYLRERFVSKINLKAFHYVNGEADPDAECARLGAIIAGHPIDVAFVGIGENGHLAFNDPPADFNTEVPYLKVQLDEACRNQQFGEGWFDTFDEVPKEAISMSVKQIMKSAHIICSVPDQRKATAVRNSVEGVVSPQVPASILQQHAHCTLFLDRESASLLQRHG